MENIKLTPTIDSKDMLIVQRANRKTRIADIIYSYTIAGFVISMIFLLSTILIPLLYVFVMLFAILATMFLTVFTFGLVYLEPNGPVKWIWDFVTGIGSDGVMGMMEFFIKGIPTASIITVSISILSIVLTSLYAKRGKIGKLVSTSIFLFIDFIVAGISLLIMWG